MDSRLRGNDRDGCVAIRADSLLWNDGGLARTFLFRSATTAAHAFAHDSSSPRPIHRQPVQRGPQQQRPALPRFMLIWQPCGERPKTVTNARHR